MSKQITVDVVTEIDESTGEEVQTANYDGTFESAFYNGDGTVTITVQE